MSDQTPTPDQILAALCTPPRDMRDEIWLRVYAQEYLAQRANPAKLSQHCAEAAAVVADLAVLHATVPAHRRPENPQP